MITGSTTGNSKIGRSTSRVRVCTVIVESSVPTTIYPTEPKTITNSSPGWNRLTLYKMLYNGSITNSTANMKIKLAITLPK